MKPRQMAAVQHFLRIIYSSFFAKDKKPAYMAGHRRAAIGHL
jgi:hypothetical protein